ncbi:hypothetical protein [Leclercia sp. UBA1284]|uniref:hypothetical protein n=1 Tax=Leclercia sp. UBA1284 TaxID=1946737 RepID=UPI00257D26EE|nr:hypothetical protein [Leclercia sp. UBA1284]
MQNSQQTDSATQNGLPTDDVPQGVDYDEPATNDGSAPRNTPPRTKAYLDRISKDFNDRRLMRGFLFAFTLILAGWFLCTGLSLSQQVATGLLSYKGTISTAVSGALNTIKEPAVEHLEALKLLSPPESIAHAEGKFVANNSIRSDVARDLVESTNWLSASPLITLVAFILGVGLTLLLALMKALFKSEVDPTEKEDGDSVLSSVATPTSKVVEDFVEWVKGLIKRK